LLKYEFGLGIFGWGPGSGIVRQSPTSNDPWLTTIFATLADMIIGLPTILKSYKDPENEKSNAWLISLFSWSLTLSISFNHDFMYAIFPIYVWLYCVTIVYLTYFRKKI
jgi:hypothetical protein